MTNKDAGYKTPLVSDKPKPRKKAKSARPLENAEDDILPVIPIPTLQETGQDLEIPPEDISVEKLMAAPPSPTTKDSNDK